MIGKGDDQLKSRSKSKTPVLIPVLIAVAFSLVSTSLLSLIHGPGDSVLIVEHLVRGFVFSFFFALLLALVISRAGSYRRAKRRHRHRPRSSVTLSAHPRREPEPHFGKTRGDSGSELTLSQTSARD